MMKAGKDVLWSLDLFGKSSSAPEQTIAPLSITVGNATVRLPTAEQEGAYLRYGRPVLQILAQEQRQQARMSLVRDVLAAGDPNFDYDVLRTALAELERRGALELAERDTRGGDHLYGLTRAGQILAG
ncbi:MULTISPECIES: hypothetical protein [Roseomonadaceae]|uniref:Uncharacterized protein n=1 Tax=Falsiroseomonas oleicola TaxID=2801474 RepID=A0ABS6H891_9PROT|nr:hypothetical protein [Roseomonas oleicola]MBU8544927.1 hypothetical protein [Roseomonas oleicola]